MKQQPESQKRAQAIANDVVTSLNEPSRNLQRARARLLKAIASTDHKSIIAQVRAYDDAFTRLENAVSAIHTELHEYIDINDIVPAEYPR